MHTPRHARLVALAVTAAFGHGCALVGPTCVARQERGSVTRVSGEVAAGDVVSHLVPYETKGSQNDANLTWNDQFAQSGPRLTFHATRAGCTDFQPPPAANGGECTILASAGWHPAGVASTLIVTHGRGNPERLGSPPEYKIWVIGDAERAVRYQIDVTWFYGPDC